MSLFLFSNVYKSKAMIWIECHEYKYDYIKKRAKFIDSLIKKQHYDITILNFIENNLFDISTLIYIYFIINM